MSVSLFEVKFCKDFIKHLRALETIIGTQTKVCIFVSADFVAIEGLDQNKASLAAIVLPKIGFDDLLYTSLKNIEAVTLRFHHLLSAINLGAEHYGAKSLRKTMGNRIEMLVSLFLIINSNLFAAILIEVVVNHQLPLQR